MRWLGVLLVVLLATTTDSLSQSNKRFVKRNLELALVPGISTNGMHSGWFINKFSFSLFSNIAAINRYFQLAGISTLNLQYATGIQLAGIANVVGSNTFINMTVSEEREQMRNGFSSDMTGIQFAGVINLVRDNMSGWQTTGGINFVHDDAKGLQLAGISNMVGGNTRGFQIAGIYNVALKSSSGFQIAFLSNLSNGTMNGIQVSAVNKAWRINGKESDTPTALSGWQIGLVNLASTMNGLQIGLINRARKMRGIQIGLINFYSTAPHRKHGKNGVPIGLINLGSQGGHQRIYISDTFNYNAEISTGNCYNCTFTEGGMPLDEKTKKMNQNAISLSYNPQKHAGRPFWAFGYGFERLHYKKNSMSLNDPKNERNFYSYGIKLQHWNFDEEITTHLSLLTKLHISYGHILRNSIFTCYVFGSITGNAYFTNQSELLNTENQPIVLNEKNGAYWPGYELGIHIY